ncbi:MAG TPA: YcaO-like family protein [Longimicrobiaceae bacterium]|nr:YcaO-like family protein [Longimicrobiaceae bacterium]
MCTALRERLRALALPFAATVLLRDAAADREETVAAGDSGDVLDVTAVGPYLVIGPLRRAGAGGACGRCFLHAAFGRGAAELQAELGGAPVLSDSILHRLGPLVRAALLSGRRPDRPVYLLDTRTGRRSRYRWEHPHPGCPEHAAIAAGPTGEGTLARELAAPPSFSPSLNRFVDPRCGIVRRLERAEARFADPCSPAGGPVWLWAGWRARPLAGGVESIVGMDADPAAARTKALMEGIERWCLEAAAHRSIVEGRMEDVPGTVDPRDFHLYTDEQYATPGFPYRRYLPEQRLRWTEGYDPVAGATRRVPLETVASVWPAGAPQPICQLTSIGTAAHGSYAAAALGALLEVMERDAVMRWWYRLASPWAAWRLPLPDDPAPGSLAPGARALTLLEISPWPELSVLLAAATAEDGRPPYLALGAGAAVRPRSAVRKAANEAVVNLLGFAARGEAPPPRFHMEPREHGEHYAWNAESLTLLDGLLPVPGAAPLPEPDAAPERDAAGDLAVVLDTLVSRECTPVLVDLTPPSLHRRGVRIVRAVVPQLLPMCFGVGQDRWGRVEPLVAPEWRARIRGHVHPFP